MQFDLTPAKSAVLFITLMTVTACDQQKQTDAVTATNTIEAANDSEDSAPQVFVPGEVLMNGKKVVDKIELYEQEHGFLPTKVTALAIIPKGWVFGIADDNSYTLTKELEKGDAKLQYRHLPNDGDAKHGAWYIITETDETILDD